MSGAKTAVAEVASVKGEFPTSSDDAGIDAMSGTYVEKVEVGTAGKITATFGDGAHNELKDHKLFLTPDKSGGGAITWACTGEEDIKAYLPSGCDVVKQSGGIDYGTPWESEFGDKGATPCWEGEVVGSRWVVGANSATPGWEESILFIAGTGGVDTASESDGAGWLAAGGAGCVE